MRKPLLAAIFASVLASSACSSSDSSSTATDSGTETKALAPLDDANCVAPGTKSNDKGMGGYCEPKNAAGTRGGECDTAGPDGAPRICTADVPDTPAHAWFCTYPCSKDDECGTGSYCAHDTKGSGCVPTLCKSLEGDSGVSDSGSDAAPDASADAVTSDAATD